VAKNGVIYIFGDVKAAEVKQLVEQALGKMKTGALALTDAKPSMPLSKPETVESRKDKAQGVIMVGFRGASLSSPDRYALELIDEASSDLGSRFFVRIREQMGLAYYVGASQMQGLVPGLFAFYLGTDPQKIEKVKTELLDEIHKLANEGLTPDELARAKKKLIGQQEIANQSNDAFGYHCALDELYGLGFDYYKQLEHDVNTVTLEDTKQVSAKYFRDQPYVLATVRPPERFAAGKPKRPMAEVQKTTLSGELSQRFIEFVVMHAQNAALFLGQIPNPRTGEAEVNLDLARMFIDQLAMIQEKTRGNLTSEEAKVLSNALSNLQMAYVEASGGARPQGAPQPEAPETAPPPAAAEQAAKSESEPSAPSKSAEPETESRKKFTKSYGP